MKMKRLMSGMTAMLLCGFVCPATAETVVDAERNSETALSIYNGNLALVKDRRSVVLGKGMNEVAFAGVAREIKPETAMISAPGLTLREQTYDYNLLTPANLLEAAVGQEVKTVMTNPANGENIFGQAKVIYSNYGSPVLQFDYGIESNFPGRVVFDKLPSGMRAKPTLTVKAESTEAGEKKVDLAYLTNGMSWRADYVAELGQNDQLDLNAMITINNESGADYKNALIQVVAGDVNQNAGQQNIMPRMMLAKASAGVADMAAEAAPLQPTREAVAGYYVYTLPFKTDLMDRQSKQVSLLSREKVSFQRAYKIESPFYFGIGIGQKEFKNLHPDMLIKLVNDEASGLGVPLPQGIIRFYENDSKGNMQFVGESAIAQKAAGEKLDLKIGREFDVSANGKVLKVKELSKDMFEAEVEVSLRNARSEEVEVKFEQRFNQNWEVLSENVRSVSQTADKVAWIVPVPAQGEKTLTFNVRVTHN